MASFKADSERQIFEVLAKLAGLDIDINSIIQRNPPSPDIECLVHGFGPLSVELVALDSQTTRTRLQNMQHVVKAWHCAYGQRSLQEREMLGEKCLNMFLVVTISAQDGLRNLIKRMAFIQYQLLVLPHFFEGHLKHFRNISRYSNEAAHFDAAQVIRGKDIDDGPRFSVISSGEWEPPQLAKIEEKLRTKIYSTSAILELFAYMRHDSADAHVESRRPLNSSATPISDRVLRCETTTNKFKPKNAP